MGPYDARRPMMRGGQPAQYTETRLETFYHRKPGFYLTRASGPATVASSMYASTPPRSGDGREHQPRNAGGRTTGRFALSLVSDLPPEHQRVPP